MQEEESVTKARYDAIADWYDVFVRSDSVPDQFLLTLLVERLGEIKGLHICDLACGQGRLSRQLAHRGAKVVGVDISVRLLTIAQGDEKAEPLGIDYVLDDAQTLRAIADETFDGVVCHMALMDVPNLESTLQTACRILRLGGWFVFTITHPCFEAPGSTWTTRPAGDIRRVVGDYFEEGYWRSRNVKGLRGQVGAYHRTLSTYVNALTQVGFTIENMLEPRATGPTADRLPGYTVVPGFLMVRCRRVEFVLPVSTLLDL